MSEVKRYEAVHIRYEDSNIRYGEGCEVEMVAAYDYDALEADRDALIDALELVICYVESNISSDYPTGVDVNGIQFQSARAAIAKARINK